MSRVVMSAVAVRSALVQRPASLPAGVVAAAPSRQFFSWLRSKKGVAAADDNKSTSVVAETTDSQVPSESAARAAPAAPAAPSSAVKTDGDNQERKNIESNRMFIDLRVKLLPTELYARHTPAGMYSSFNQYNPYYANEPLVEKTTAPKTAWRAAGLTFEVGKPAPRIPPQLLEPRLFGKKVVGPYLSERKIRLIRQAAKAAGFDPVKDVGLPPVQERKPPSYQLKEDAESMIFFAQRQMYVEQRLKEMPTIIKTWREEKKAAKKKAKLEIPF